MKLITAIINKDDANTVCKNLSEAGYFFTRLSTQGGFLLSGNITVLCGVEDEKVDGVIDIIAKYSSKRKELVPTSGGYGFGLTNAYPASVTVGGATVFVTNVERFEKL